MKTVIRMTNGLVILPTILIVLFCTINLLFSILFNQTYDSFNHYHENGYVWIFYGFIIVFVVIGYFVATQDE